MRFAITKLRVGALQIVRRHNFAAFGLKSDRAHNVEGRGRPFQVRILAYELAVALVLVEHGPLALPALLRLHHLLFDLLNQIVLQLCCLSCFKLIVKVPVVVAFVSRGLWHEHRLFRLVLLLLHLQAVARRLIIIELVIVSLAAIFDVLDNAALLIAVIFVVIIVVADILIRTRRKDAFHGAKDSGNQTWLVASLIRLVLFFSVLSLALDWELPLVLMAFLVDHLIVAQAPVDIWTQKNLFHGRELIVLVELLVISS